MWCKSCLVLAAGSNTLRIMQRAVALLLHLTPLLLLLLHAGSVRACTTQVGSTVFGTDASFVCQPSTFFSQITECIQPSV
jgi:hypothetical protein